MLPVDIDIREVLPQGECFRMVDRLMSWSLDVTVTSLKVNDGNFFCRDGLLTTGGLVETIAQTSAARIGYYHKFVLHKDVNIGFIGAIQNMTVNRRPAVGETITTRIEVKAEAFGMVSFDAEIRDENGGLIASGQMKTAE